MDTYIIINVVNVTFIVIFECVVMYVLKPLIR